MAIAASAAVCGQSAPEAAQKTVNRYCFACHNDQLKTGAVSLQHARLADVPGDAPTWEKVLRKVRAGEMPPLGAAKPDAASAWALLSVVEAGLDQAALAKPNPGTPSIHRLNRAEYSNAVRDLLGLDFDHSASLPADDSGYGFDNIGEVLSVSPMLMEKYMSAGRRVARLAVGTVRTSTSIEKYTGARTAARGSSDELPLSERGGLVIHRYFPVDAEYSILARVRGNPDPNQPRPRLDLRVDGKRVELFDVQISQAEEAQSTRNYEIRIPLKAGMHTLGAGFLMDALKSEAGVVQRRAFGPPPAVQPASVDYLLVGGPFKPTGPGETESRRRVFVCRPAAGEAEEKCAKRILTGLARRAYRRPAQAADLALLMKLFAAGRTDGGSFDAGIETALRAILVSPGFLFRTEHDPKGAAPGTVHPVTDLELASRLSFFLWSSIPDEELLHLAERKALRPVLEQQVRRMLADPKSAGLVENFAGQWLHLRNISGWRPDPDKYPQFDESLRDAMQSETEYFFRYIVHEDRTVLDFINAGYTFVNARLAAHYGIPGVRGSYFRRVAVNPAERGGILSQGGILTVTSYPTRTSPVLRGKWILENVLGSPPPPPPPDVPVLAESASTSPKDLRAALEKHRANAACAACHSRLDPLGFALENYDAVGKFRQSEGGTEIDASGSMPSGVTVRGPGELKKVLMERQDEFVECVAEKLLTYALGRGLEYYDLPAARKVRREAAQNDYRFSSLALAIVNSIPFQMRRSPER